MSFKDPNHGIGGSGGTIHDGGGVLYPGGNPSGHIPGTPGHGDGGGVLYPGGNPSGHIPGWPESSPGEPDHCWDNNHEWHEPYNDHCWDYNDYCWDYYNDYYYNCEYTDYCYEPSTYEFHGGF